MNTDLRDKNRTSKIKSFTDLLTWKEGHKLVILVYLVTKKFPKEDFDKLVYQVNFTHQLLQGLITKSKTFIIRKS